MSARAAPAVASSAEPAARALARFSADLEWRAILIELRDGRVLRKRIDHALGEPENPVGREALIHRFIEMTAQIPDARRMAERILHLEREPDLSVLEALA